MFLRRLKDEEKPLLKGANMSAIQPVYELFSQNIDSLGRLHKYFCVWTKAAIIFYHFMFELTFVDIY